MNTLVTEVYYPDAPGEYRYLIKTPIHLLQSWQRVRIVQSTQPISKARKGILNLVIASIIKRSGKEVNSVTMRDYMKIAEPRLFRIKDISGQELTDADKEIILYYHPNYYKSKPEFKAKKFEKAFQHWVDND